MTIERLSNSDYNLLNELREPTEKLLNNHFENAKLWYPHEEIPFTQAISFDSENPWSPEQYPLPEGVREAILVNLLTEDNLPYYFNTLSTHSIPNHPLREWNHQWTMEEWKHSAVMRDWVLTTRAIDPIMLEDSRRVQMKLGEVPVPESLADLIVYTSFQELATQVAHRNTGKALDKDKLGKRVMALVAGDEKLHHEFYVSLTKYAFEIDPSTLIIAALRQLKGFKMPGTGIPDFASLSKKIEKAGIYDIPQFYDNVVVPTLSRWNIDDMENISDEAKIARDKLNRYVSMLSKIAIRQSQNK